MEKKKYPPSAIIYLWLYPFFFFFTENPRNGKLIGKKKKREKCLPSELFIVEEQRRDGFYTVCCRERTEVSTIAKIFTVTEVLLFICLDYNQTKQD